MDEWNTASYCSKCHKEISDLELLLKDKCPHCKAQGRNNITEHYDRHYRLVLVRSGFLGIGKKYKRVFDEEELEEN